MTDDRAAASSSLPPQRAPENDELWTHVVGDSNTSDDMLDFAPARAELVTLVKEAFPDNAKIQALPDKRQ